MADNETAAPFNVNHLFYFGCVVCEGSIVDDPAILAPFVATAQDWESKVFGHVDQVGPTISGWVWGGTTDRMLVTCRVDGIWEVTVEAGLFRADVRDAGYGDGFAGFTLQVPKELCDSQERRLELWSPQSPGWAFPGFPAKVVLGTPNAIVQRLSADDAPAFERFWTRLMHGELKEEPAKQPASQQYLLDLLRNPNCAAFGLSANGGIVGYCVLEDKKAHVYRHVAVLRIALLVGYRGRGLGKKLMASVLDCAQRLGLRRVELTVSPSNLPARRLYESLGFVAEGVLREAYFNGQQYHDEIMMALLLPQTDANKPNRGRQ